MTEILEKKCSKCGNVKPTSEFSRRTSKSNQLSSYCRGCIRELNRNHTKELVDLHTDEYLLEYAKSHPWKLCNKCNELKSINDFHILRQRIDGHDETCIDCRKTKYREQVTSMSDEAIDKNDLEHPFKVCSQCGLIKSAKEFSICRETSDGHYHYCNACKVIRMQEYYHNTIDYRIEYRDSHKKETSIRYRNNNINLKVEVLTHYSNSECKCVVCGESRLPCLSIDHINGGGSRHRKSIGGLSGVRFYKWMMDNKLPTGYQTLCINCQFLKSFRNPNPLKKEILTHYGDGKCQCVVCGEDRLLCLSIDHINNDGGKHRREIRYKSGHVDIYKWLKDNKLPKGFQTLCMNDQFIKQFAHNSNKVII